MINKETEAKLLIAGCEILCGFSLQEIINNELEKIEEEALNDNS